MPVIKLSNVTIAYPVLDKPQENKFNGEPNYSCQIRLYKDNPQQAAQAEVVIEAMKKAAAEKWGSNAAKMWKVTQQGVNTRFLRYEEEGGYYFMNLKRRPNKATESGAPLLVAPDLSKLPEGKVRGGDIVNVNFSVWPYDNSGNRGFSSTLLGVQWVCEGELALGGPAVTENTFEAITTNEKSSLADVEGEDFDQIMEDFGVQL